MKKNKMRWCVVIFTFLFTQCLYMSANQPGVRTAEEILRSYVEDFQADSAAAEPMTFGIRIKDESEPEWHVSVLGKKDANGNYLVELHKGLPTTPSAIYSLDLKTLQKIDSGEMNALTAMGKARASDKSPMDLEFMSGFKSDATFIARFIPFTFHFWTRGFPETVVFGEQHSREVHGANMVVFYYQKGLRSAWGQIDKGQHVNKDPKYQVNPFPTMIIVIRGKAAAKIGGKEVMLQAGQMVFIPAGFSHEAWNPYDEPAEVIILMFGEGA